MKRINACLSEVAEILWHGDDPEADLVCLGWVMTPLGDAPRFPGHRPAAVLFVEPESPVGRALAASFGGSALVALPMEPLAEPMAALAACFRADGGEAELARLGQQILDMLAGAAEAPAADPRVTAMLAYAEERFGGVATLPEAGARGLPVAQPRAPFVRRADRAAVQDLRAVAPDQPGGRALCRGGVADRGGARSRLCELGPLSAGL